MDDQCFLFKIKVTNRTKKTVKSTKKLTKRIKSLICYIEATKKRGFDAKKFQN
jgi:hypothetical protein